MATQKQNTKLEKIYEKYGVQGNPPSSNKDKGKQNNSASSTRSTAVGTAKTDTKLEKIYEKYGISGTPKSQSNTAYKVSDNSDDPAKKYTDYNTETKNAYASVKNKMNSKTTIASDLTDDERKKRISEINSELIELQKVRNGLSRGAMYGDLSDEIAKNEARQKELAEEKKKLERVGTFTGTEMLQQEIDDAKSKVASLSSEVAKYGNRPSKSVAEEYRGAYSKVLDAKAELEELEKQKALYDDISEFGDVVNEDDFSGQWRANYRSTDISEKAGKAFATYLDNPTDENLEIAYAYDAFAKEYMKNNAKALDDEGQVLPLLSNNFSRYIAQTKGQLGLAVPLGLAGAGLGLVGGGAGAKVGWTTGYSMGAGINSYNVIRGSLYSELLSYGLDEETARKLANDDAIIEGLIESGETAKDWAFTLFSGGANLLTKGGSKVVAKGIDKVAGAAAKSAAKPFLNLGWNILKGTGLNAGTEYLEEFSQGGVSRATREKAWATIDNEIGRYGEGNIDLHNRPVYKNGDGSISTVDSVTFQIDGKFIVLPTIVRDEKGNAKRLFTDEEIFAYYEKTGEYLGEFDTLEEANIYANRLHYAQAYRYSDSTSVDADDSTLKGGVKVITDALFGGNAEARGELHEQGMEGLKTGAITGGIQGSIKFVVSSYATAKSVKAQNEIAEFVKNDEETLNALIEEGKASGEGTVSAKIAKEVEQAKEKGEVTREQVKKLIASNEVYIKAEEQATADSTTPETVTSDVVTKKSGSPLAERLDALSQNNEAIAVEDVKKATGFGEEGSKLVTELASKDGMTFLKARDEIKVAYLSGYNGENIAVTGDLQNRAKLAGIDDRIADNNIAIEQAKNATVYDGAFTENEYTKNWSDATKKMVSTVAKHFGMDISVVDKIIANELTGAEASASHYDGKMEISNNRSAGKLIHALVMHESGHRMEQFATAEWNELANFLYERAETLGRRVKLGLKQGMVFESVKAEHDNAGITRTTRDYIGEIAVRELETIFSSAEEFNSFIAEIESNQQVKSAWSKFVEWLSKLIEDLKTAWSQRKMTTEERQALAELERIKELYAKAYLATKDAVTERRNEVNSERTQKNTDSESGVNFSLKNKNLTVDSRIPFVELKNYINVTKNDYSSLNALESKVKNLKRGTYQNDATGYSADINADTIRKAIHPTHNNFNPFTEGHIRNLNAMANLPKLFKNAVYIDSRSPQKGKNQNPSYKEYHHFVAPIFMNGGEYRALITAREKVNSNTLYVLKVEVLPTQKRHTLSATQQNNAVGSQWLSVPSDISIPELVKDVKIKNYDTNTEDTYNGGDIKFSLKDSEGNTLTEAQAEYFKDSKVTDGNGNLLVMYQGSAEDFTVFDRKKSSYANLYGRGFYFTKSENHASQYGNTRAYYLNIKHPVSTTETTITKPQLHKFLQAVVENEDYSFENYGYGATVESVLKSVYGKSDFLMLNDISQTAIGDLVEAVELFNKVNKTDYDGIILDTETVTFNSEQAKLTSNQNPTSNPDTRFSLEEPVEETKDLIAVHNLWEEKLLKSLKLGGFPMPSIAIVRAKEGHSNFGNISLVFRKDTISPTDRRNKVYSGDAWTPTYPYIEYKLNEKAQEKIEKKISTLVPRDIASVFGGLHLDSYNMEHTLNRSGDLVSSYMNNYAMRYAFLRDSGVDIELPMKNASLSRQRKVSDEAIIKIAETVPEEVLHNAIDGENNDARYKSEPAIREAISEAIQEKYKDKPDLAKLLLPKEELSLGTLMDCAEDALRYKREGVKQEIDYGEATSLINEKTDATKYEAWLKELFSDVIAKEGIRNDKDLFTPSGNRRSFEALHYEHTLENVVKAMKESGTIGIGGFGGNSILGSSAVEYGSISEIKEKASERMKTLPQEEYEEIRKGFTDRFFELAGSLPIHKDSFSAIDDAANMLCEAVIKYKTKSGMANYLRNESKGWATYSDHVVDDLVDLVNDIRNMPTNYFEAKPQRAVGFNEVTTAIIPDNASKELKAKLAENNVPFVEYEAGNENARLEALNSLEDVKFSLKGTNNIDSKDRKELLDIIEHLKGEFEVTEFAKPDPKKLAKMTKDLLKEYSSQADYDETYNAINELYKYIANGIDGHPPVWEDVYNQAYEIAKNIAENALFTDDSTYREYKSLRDYLRNTPMKFYAGFDGVPSAYENFNDFRKHNMGRLKFTKDGMGIDAVYQELSSLYPQFFDADVQTDSASQLERMVDVLDEIQPMDINPFDGQIEQVSMQIANDITSRFFDVPQAKPTFADKAERRVIDATIKGAKKANAVRQQRDAKIQKLMESQKAKTKKQLDKLRQQRDDRVKKEQAKRREAISKMSESQKVKVLRAKIIQHTSDISKKLLKPTDNQHIPYELQGAVAKLLECINLESNYTYDPESHSYKKSDEGLPTKRTQAFNELKKLYSEMASSMVVDPDLLGENGWLSDVISLADKRIVDMNSSELNTVWQAIRAIEASISTANKIFAEGKFATVLEFAEALREDNAGKKEKTEFKGVVGKGKKLATLDMLTPETYFHYLGSAGDSIFRMMRDAQDKHISIMKEVADFTHEALKDVDVNSLEKTTHTVKLGGEDVKLSTAQLMELYVLMKREQAIDHILVGGILPDVTEGKGWKLNTKAEPIRNISVAEISEATSKLTEEQKKVADKLQKFVSTVLSEYGNEASMKVYNYEKFLEKNYWTIRTNKQEIVSEIGKDTAVTSVANKGMAKGTVPHANTSVRIGSIFDTFASHSSDMATYAAWLGASEDVNRIRNFVFWDDGTRTGTVKGILDTVHGIHGSEYLQKLLTDVSIGVKGTDNMNPFDKLIGSYKAASVGANLRVIIQQPTAILRAMDMIDARYLAEGAVRPLEGWKKAKKYAPIAQWKDWGHFDINTGRQMKDVLFDNASLLEKTKQVGMWGASMADSLAWGNLWNAVEAETKAKHKGFEVGSEEYYETVAKRFTEIVDHTQVVDGILQRSQIMRSPDALTKMATSFMGEPTKQYNMAVSAAYDAINEKGDARKKAVARLGRTAMSLAVAGIINACAQSIIDAMRDDDKEKDYWEKWLAAFMGDGEDTNLLNSNLGDTINPLNYVPFAKDVISVMQGYDVKRMDAEAISKTFNALKNMHKAVTGTGKYTIVEASANLFAETARLYGLPVANVKRDIKSLVMSFAIETDNYLMQYRIEKAMLDINYAGNGKNFMDILFNAYNNDREAYEYIYKDMLKSGYDAEKIESGMEPRMKKAEGVEKTTELTKRYMTPEDEKKYDSSLNKVKSSDVWKSANAEQRKDAESNLYKFLTSTAEDVEKIRAEARAFGVDETEYTLWQLAKEMVDDNSSMDAKEKAEAIGMLDLGDSEIAYFYSTKVADEAYANGIDMTNYAMFKGAVSGLKGDNKESMVVQYANKYADTEKEFLFFMGTEYSSYKKRGDYIKYFGK